MIFISFGNKAFNKDYETNIDMVISPKSKYEDGFLFVKEALEYIDKQIYPGEGFLLDYKGLYLRNGEYRDIIEHWILSMSEAIEINFSEIIKIQRIKCEAVKPLQDEFLIETQDEYIMFLWGTTA